MVVNTFATNTALPSVILLPPCALTGPPQMQVPHALMETTVTNVTWSVTLAIGLTCVLLPQHHHRAMNLEPVERDLPMHVRMEQPQLLPIVLPPPIPILPADGNLNVLFVDQTAAPTPDPPALMALAMSQFA
jgi:hypothetical protein